MESILGIRHPIDVTFTDEDVIVTLSDSTKVSNPLAWHWWLHQATPQQRANVEYYPYSIDWPGPDEGLDIEGMLRGIKPKQPRSVVE